MTISNDNKAEFHDIKYLSSENEQAARNFALAKVYEHCENNPDCLFSVASLFESDWRGTPLQEIYENCCEAHGRGEFTESPDITAGLWAGALLRSVLLQDGRDFLVTKRREANPNNQESRHSKANHYIWHQS